MSAKSSPKVREMDKAHGVAVREARELRGWNQAELARRLAALGLTHFRQVTISRVEMGDQALRLGEACAIADLFGFDDVEEFFDRGGNMRARLMVEQLDREIAEARAALSELEARRRAFE